MSYQLEWDPGALADFAKEWESLTPARRRIVNDSLDDLDHLLTTAPMLEGESRDSEFQRVVLREPVLLRFDVDPRRKVVRVVSARLRKTA